MVCLGLEPGAAEWKAEINLFEYKNLLKNYVPQYAELCQFSGMSQHFL